jgi:vitamin K-dependent gamma-carboxylase-like protein
MSASRRALLERVFGIDRRALAVVRIGLGAALLADLVFRAGWLRATVTDDGFLPRKLLEPWMRETVAPLHLLSGDFGYQVVLFVLAGVLALLLLLGRFTRVAAIGSWALLISLHARNPLVLNFGDAVLRVSLFWAMCLPLASRWSLDAARARQPPDPRPVSSIASAAFLLQICFVYFFTAVAKSGRDWHSDGLALYYALQLDWMVLPPAFWLREHLLATKLLTWSTLGWEYVGPFLLLAPLWWMRLVGVLGFAALHLGISATLRLGVFPFVDLTVLAAFLPPEVWDRLEALVRRGPRRAAPAARATGSSGAAARLAVRACSAVLVGLVGLVFAANIVGVGTGDPAARLPAPLVGALRALGLEQRWQMFSPNVPRLDGWFVMPARLADGRLIDASPHGPALDWHKPKRIAADFSTVRVGILLLHQLAHQSTNGLLRRAYARFVCFDWNRTHPPSQRMERIDLFFMREESVPPGATPQITPRYMASHPCARPGAAPGPGWDVTVPESGSPPPPLAAPPRN